MKHETAKEDASISLSVINAALINRVSRQKLSTRALMEPSNFKRPTSRVKRWKGERLRHRADEPASEERDIFTRLYTSSRCCSSDSSLENGS